MKVLVGFKGKDNKPKRGMSWEARFLVGMIIIMLVLILIIASPK